MKENEDQGKDVPGESEPNHDPNKQNKVDNVIYTIKPALILENLFGIFRFCKIDNDLVKTNRKMKCIAILTALTYISVISTTIRFPTAISGIGNLVDAIDEIPTMVVLVQYITGVITTSFFLCETTIRIFSSYAELDTMLHINLNEDYYRTSRRRTIVFLILLIASHVMFDAADQLTDNEFVAVKNVVLALYLEQDLEIFVFCKMVYMLNSRLIVINDYLAQFVLEQQNTNSIFTMTKKYVSEKKKFNFIGRSSENNMKIRDLAVMYDVIGETCSSINEVFNFQIFMNLVSTFMYVVITIWTSLYYFRTPDDVSGQLITVIIWCISTVFSVAVMSFTCESLLSTRRHTKILVNEIIMDYDLPKTMRVQAKVFMELIEAWPLRIFVYDMFSVDITLMLKFISVATTYLIVVIQVSHFI